MQRRTLLKATAGPALASLGAPLFAQQAPVRILIGFAAGGGLDAMARVVAEQLKEAIGRRSWWTTRPAHPGGSRSRR